MDIDLNTFKPFLVAFAADERISVWHMAMMFGILQLVTENDEVVLISRKKVMQLAHIKNIVTYHKYIKELQNLGYIKYFPSYHPGIRSTVELNRLILAVS